MPESPQEALRAPEAVLKALANRRRLGMLLALQHHQEMHVSALADVMRLSIKTVSRHLRLLERSGLVRSEPRRGFTYYRLNPRAPSLSLSVLGAVQVGEIDALSMRRR